MKKGDIPLATPCTLDWRSMTVVDKGRFCGECKKVVRDLSSLDEAEARRVLSERAGGELCVRYLTDRDGTVVFANAARPLVPMSSLLRSKSAALLAASLAVTGCSAGADGTSESSSEQRQEQRQEERQEYTENMGGMAYQPPTEVPEQGDASTGDAGTSGDTSDSGGPRDPRK